MARSLRCCAWVDCRAIGPPRPGWRIGMGVFDALTTAVTGLQAQSFALQNISGNIANSQTTAFKRTETSFADLVQDNVPKLQTAGSVTATSRSTNSVQGSIQSASVGTFMAISGDGYLHRAEAVGLQRRRAGLRQYRPLHPPRRLSGRQGRLPGERRRLLPDGHSDRSDDRQSGRQQSPGAAIQQRLPSRRRRRPRFRTPPILPRIRAGLAMSPGVPGSELLNPANYSPIRSRVPRRPPRSPAPVRRCRRTHPPW